MATAQYAGGIWNHSFVLSYKKKQEGGMKEMDKERVAAYY